MSTCENIATMLLVADFVCKFILCVLRTQEGKTFTVIHRIAEEINQDHEKGRSIHMIFTMNTLLNNKQFGKRVDGCLDQELIKRLEHMEKTHGKGTVCVLASKYKGPFTLVRKQLELRGLCADEKTCPRVIILCSNSRRFDDGVDFLDFINRTKNFHIKRAFIYYDELHKYINDMLRVQIETIHTFDIVCGIMALTATPRPIWQEHSPFWKSIRIIDLDNFNDENYAGYGDMIFNRVDDFFPSPYQRPRDFDTIDRQTIGFIEHVLTRYPNIIQRNTRSFIPAHIRRSGHNQVRELVFRLRDDAVVVVLNGVEKNLQYIDEGHIKTIPLTSDDQEVCETIAEKIKEHHLDNRPLIITGYLCVGMGQTLTHSSLGPFTSAIFSHLDISNEDIYQLFGRVTGRMKTWPTYLKTEIYCPRIIEDRINVMEQCARNMAREHNGKIATRDDYDAPMLMMGEIGQAAIKNIRQKRQTTKRVEDTSVKKLPFDTQEEALLYVSTELNIKLHKRSEQAIGKSYLDKNGNRLSEDAAFKRWKHQSGDGKPRMVPIANNKWLLFWKPTPANIVIDPSLKEPREISLVQQENSVVTIKKRGPKIAPK